MLITSVITACSCNTLKPNGLARRQEGEQDKVQFPLASFSEMSRATGRGDFC